MSCWWTSSYYERGETYPGYRYASDEQFEPATPVQIGVSAAKYKRPCAEPHGHDESDLCAQWRAAKAAERGALWGLVQMILSAFGVVGLAITLWYNRHALRLAREANKVSQRNGEAQVRCYLSISNAWVTMDRNILKVQARVMNSGQSPALRASFSYELSLGGAEAKALETRWYEDIPVGKYEAVEWHCPTPLSDDQVELWGQSAKTFVGLTVRISAKDVFDKDVPAYAAYVGIPDSWDDGEPHELGSVLHAVSAAEGEKARRRVAAEKQQGTANDDNRNREA